MKNQSFSFISMGILSLLLVVGCDRLSHLQLEAPSEATPSIQLTVSAAASLKEVMEDIKLVYREKYPETDIIYNFAASGSLQRQIEQGAPVDVFISAADQQMDALEEKGLLVTKTRQDLLKNRMVLITPVNNTKNRERIGSFGDLTNKEITVIALGEPASVPVGKYAQEILSAFKIAAKVNPKAVYGKDVRQVVNYVATGNADAGIVYRTDAHSENVEIVATAPENTHSPVIYPIAVIQDSDRRVAATELVEFLATPAAQAVFVEHGFVSVISQNNH